MKFIVLSILSEFVLIFYLACGFLQFLVHILYTFDIPLFMDSVAGIHLIGCLFMMALDWFLPSYRFHMLLCWFSHKDQKWRTFSYFYFLAYFRYRACSCIEVCLNFLYILNKNHNPKILVLTYFVLYILNSESCMDK